MNATLESHGFKVRYPAGLSAPHLTLRHNIQAIKSDMIINCLPGVPATHHNP